MLIVAAWFIIALVFFEVCAMLTRIGKPRPILTGGMAVGALIEYTAIVVVVLLLILEVTK